MRIEITSKSLEMTDSLKDHISKRLVRLKRYFDGVLDFHVVVRVERFVYKFEITLHGQGFDFFSEDKAEDLYASFEGAADKMETQVKKLKDKTRRRRSRPSGVAPVGSVEPAEPDDFADET